MEPTLEQHSRVAFFRAAQGTKYASTPPYHPSEAYPEYPFGTRLGREPNPAYEAVRGALHLLGFDAGNYGTPSWNPLAELIRPDDLVVIKPNMVRDFHEDRREGTEALITHGSVLRAIVDYVYLAKGRRGKVIIADSPQNDADWSGLWKAFAFDDLLAFYKATAPDFEIRIYDARIEAVRKRHGVVVHRYRCPGDPFGYSRIDLGDSSEFAPVPERTGKLYGAEYDISATEEHHRPGKHEYLIANTFLQADVLINAPKIKTHKKSGITVWMKSVIGICGDKNWLPHHTEGTPSQGGDQFAEDTFKRRAEQRVVHLTKRVLRRAGKVGGYVGSVLRKAGSYVFGDTNISAIRSGNWHGNDTIWRTALDLHKCWIYADKNGRLKSESQRRFLCLADGIVAGEGNGPLAPKAKPCGICIAGTDPIAVDTAAGVLMGLDIDRLKVLTRAPEAKGYKLNRVKREEIRCVSNVADWNGDLNSIRNPLDFLPHFGWVGYLERKERRRETDGEAPA